MTASSCFGITLLFTTADKIKYSKRYKNHVVGFPVTLCIVHHEVSRHKYQY